jgi:hypothetical protein
MLRWATLIPTSLLVVMMAVLASGAGNKWG